MANKTRGVAAASGALLLVAVVVGFGSAAVAGSQNAPLPLSEQPDRPFPTSLATPGPEDALDKLYPPAMPVPPGTKVISESDAIEIAEAAHGSTNIADVSGKETAPPLAKQMTISEADALISTGVKGLVDDLRPVWVVTIYKEMATDPVPSIPGVSMDLPTSYPYYSLVIDGYTRWPIVLGIGSNALGGR